MDHISFSAIKDWMSCPHLFKVVWIDKSIKFHGNTHTAYGTAVHSVLEYKVIDKRPKGFTNWEDFFEQEFLKSIKKSLSDGASKSDFNKDLIGEMREHGKEIIHLVVPALSERFGNFKVIGSEINLLEPIENSEIKFKGFVDLIIMSEDGKIHIIDHKTSTAGWFRREIGDKKIIYQLVYYKHFVAKKLDINPNEIDVHFLLLKRKARKEKMIEFIDITSGNKRTENALEIMREVLKSYETNNFPKIKKSCDAGYGCILKGTVYCRKIELIEKVIKH